MSPDRRKPKSQSPPLPSYDEAAELVAAYAARLVRLRPGVERVRLDQALGRVLAEPLRADADQPPFARSTRDGFACRAAEASTHRPLAVAGSTRAGQSPSGPLPRGAAWEIMTGAPVPAGADAVVMLEHVEELDAYVEESGSASARAIRLLPPRTIRKGENIVARGAQARKGGKLLPAGSLIGSAQIALAGSCGCTSLNVFLKPRVAILSTGDELVPIRSSPG
ncbi:MAG: molybdopterin molybdenumtransferase MoeA, partial [Terracidiphilus sp.]